MWNTNIRTLLLSLAVINHGFTPDNLIFKNTDQSLRHSPPTLSYPLTHPLALSNPLTRHTHVPSTHQLHSHIHSLTCALTHMRTHSPPQHDRTVHERVPRLQQRSGVRGVQGALSPGPQNASARLPTRPILQLRQGRVVFMFYKVVRVMARLMF